MVQDKGLSDRVQVRHFHGWCMDQLKTHKLPTPDSRQYRGDEYVAQLVHQVIQAVNQGTIPTERYGAIAEALLSEEPSINLKTVAAQERSRNKKLVDRLVLAQAIAGRLRIGIEELFKPLPQPIRTIAWASLKNRKLTK